MRKSETKVRLARHASQMLRAYYAQNGLKIFDIAELLKITSEEAFDLLSEEPGVYSLEVVESLAVLLNVAGDSLYVKENKLA